MDRIFEQDVKINRFKLDLCAEEQPSFFHYWGDELAQAKKKLEKLKNKLDLELASKALFYRNNPKDGIKVTESSIDSMVFSDAQIVALKDEIADQNFEVNSFQVKVTSLEHRKSMITDLRNLQVSGYYQIPGTSGPVGDAEDKARQQLNRRSDS